MSKKSHSGPGPSRSSPSKHSLTVHVVDPIEPGAWADLLLEARKPPPIPRGWYTEVDTLKLLGLGKNSRSRPLKELVGKGVLETQDWIVQDSRGRRCLRAIYRRVKP